VVPDHVAPQNLDETPLRGELPRPHAERLAREKARAAVQAGQFVLAADTVVAVGRRILPKAETEAEADLCLALLSGRRHHVLTAVVLIGPDGGFSARLSESVVTFARLTAAQHRAYLESGEWQGKAGGYAIQGQAAGFVRALSGSFSGVVGLPLFETVSLLRGRGFLQP
jgi:septum formation protein